MSLQDQDTTTENKPAELPDGEYAIVELFGHQTLVGRVTEVERFGAKMMSIEVVFNGTLLPPMMHGGAAIYRFTPCTKEIAAKRGHVDSYTLPAAMRAMLPPTALPSPSLHSEEDHFEEEEPDDDEPSF